MKLSEELIGRKVKNYYFIDRTGRSNGGPVRPEVGEVITFESEYLGDHTENWLVSRFNGKILRIVNVVDLANITFEG